MRKPTVMLPFKENGVIPQVDQHPKYLNFQRGPIIDITLNQSQNSNVPGNGFRIANAPFETKRTPKWNGLHY